MKRTLLGLVAVVLLGTSACGGHGLPYSASEMKAAQKVCDDAFVSTSVLPAMEGEVVDFDQVGCLRDQLPKLSDDQLERIDSLIADAG